MNHCPPSSDLVELLGMDDSVSNDGDLRSHVEGCSDCKSQLQFLQRSFALLGAVNQRADHLPTQTVDAVIVHRIQQSVRSEIAQERRAPVVMGTQGVIGALLALAVLVVWWKLLAHGLSAPLGLLLLLLPIVLPLTLLRSLRTQWIGLGLGWTFVFAVVASSQASLVVPWFSGLGCLALLGSGVIGPALALSSSVRRFGTDGLRAAILGVAIGSGGTALQHSLCSLGGLAHLIGVHLLPLLIGTCALAWLGAHRMIRLPKSYGPA